MDLARIAIDFARVDEIARIAAMSRDLIETGLGWHYRPARIRGLLADPDAVVVVARATSSIAGFAAMTIGEERAHLVLLAVDPAFRRAGLGRRLLGWLLASAATAGVATVHVELRAANAVAHRLYRSLGFVETHRVQGYYRGAEPAVKMLKLLRTPSTSS